MTVLGPIYWDMTPCQGFGVCYAVIDRIRGNGNMSNNNISLLQFFAILAQIRMKAQISLFVLVLTY